MAAYIRKARELYKAFDYGSEDIWRDRQAKWVNEDVMKRGAPLSHDEQESVKARLLDSGSGPPAYPDEHLVAWEDLRRVTIKTSGDLEYTSVFETEHLLPVPWFGFGKQAPHQAPKSSKPHVRRVEQGYRVTWSVTWEVVTNKGLLRKRRHYVEEDVPGFAEPFTRQRGRKRKNKNSSLVFKTSFGYYPATAFPFWPRVGDDVKLQRSEYGKELLAHAQSVNGRPQEPSRSSRR